MSEPGWGVYCATCGVDMLDEDEGPFTEDEVDAWGEEHRCVRDIQKHAPAVSGDAS